MEEDNYEHGYSPIAKACHCAKYIQQNCSKNATGLYAGMLLVIVM